MAANGGLQIEIGVSEREYLRALARLEARTVSAANGIEKRFKTANKGVERSFSRADDAASRFAGGGLRNVSLQLSQVAQSASATGRPLQALAIQIPDLALAFGPLGIALGAVAGGLLTFAANSMRAKSGADELDRVSLSGIKGQVSDLLDLEDRYASALAARAATQSRVSDQAISDMRGEIEAKKALLDLERARLELDRERLRSEVAQARKAFDQSMRVGIGATEDRSNEPFVRTQGQRDRLTTLRASLDADPMAALELGAQEAQLTQTETALRSLENVLSGNTERVKEGRAAFKAQGTEVENILALVKDVRRVLGQTPSAQERVLREYSKHLDDLKRVRADLATAESALAGAERTGDVKGMTRAGAAVRELNRELNGLLDTGAQLQDMSASTADLIELLGAVEFDGNAEARASAEDLAAKIEAASEEGDSLSQTRLDGLKTEFKDLTFIVGGLLDSIGMTAEKLKSLSVPDELEGTLSSLDGASDGRRASAALLRKFEGFRATPYDDGARDGEGKRVGPAVYRAGFGSDTVTLADGTVQRIVEGMRVSVADGNRDLSRRIGEFQEGIIDQIGRERFESFNPAQQAALTSVAYNYGSIGQGGAGIADTVRTGSVNEIAEAIRGLGSHNGGINAGRRATEAAVFSRGLGVESAALRQESETARAQADSERAAAAERKKALNEEIRLREEALRVRQDLRAQAHQLVGDAEFEAEIVGKSASEQARLRTEYRLTQQAKRDGIDLTERLAGTEETYADAIRETARLVGEATAAEARRSEVQEDVQRNAEAYAAVQADMKSGILDAIAAGRDFDEVLGGIAQSLARAALEAALFGEGMAAGKMGMQGGGGLLGGLVSGFGRLMGAPSPAPKMAGNLGSGGVAKAGNVYRVGEHGPEPFVPAVNGRVLSTAQAQKALQPASPAMGPVSLSVPVTVRNETGAQVEATRTASGGVDIRVFHNAMDSYHTSGRGDRAMRQAYGVTRKPMGSG